MRKYLYAVLALLFSVSAFAQQDYPRDITLNWDNPTQYVDNSFIDAGDLAAIRVQCFRSNDIVPTFEESRPDTGEGAHQSETYIGVIPGPGSYTCYAFAIVVGGVESDTSNGVLKKYTGKPLPPQTFE